MIMVRVCEWWVMSDEWVCEGAREWDHYSYYSRDLIRSKMSLMRKKGGASGAGGSGAMDQKRVSVTSSLHHSLTHLLSHNCSCCASLLSLWYSTTRLPRATSRMIRSWSYVRLSSCLTRTRRAPSTCTSSRCAVFSSCTPALQIIHSFTTHSLWIHCESTVPSWLLLCPTLLLYCLLLHYFHTFAVSITPIPLNCCVYLLIRCRSSCVHLGLMWRNLKW